jgi:hypothetical protein
MKNTWETDRYYGVDEIQSKFKFWKMPCIVIKKARGKPGLIRVFLSAETKAITNSSALCRQR